MSGNYMTKEGVNIICKNCLYYNETLAVIGTCGNANQKQRYVNQSMKCEHFWPKEQFRK